MYPKLKPAAVPPGRQRSALSVVMTLYLLREGRGLAAAVLFLSLGPPLGLAAPAAAVAAIVELGLTAAAYLMYRKGTAAEIRDQHMQRHGKGQCTPNQ
jgi:hypothetical protein